MMWAGWADCQARCGWRLPGLLPSASGLYRLGFGLWSGPDESYPGRAVMQIRLIVPTGTMALSRPRSICCKGGTTGLLAAHEGHKQASGHWIPTALCTPAAVCGHMAVGAAGPDLARAGSRLIWPGAEMTGMLMAFSHRPAAQWSMRSKVPCVLKRSSDHCLNHPLSILIYSSCFVFSCLLSQFWSKFNLLTACEPLQPFLKTLQFVWERQKSYGDVTGGLQQLLL